MYGIHYFNRGALLRSVLLFEAPNDQGLKALAEEIKVAAKKVQDVGDEAKKAAETALTEVRNLGKMTTETKEGFDKKFTELNGHVEKVTKLGARLDEVEQKMARRGKDDDERPEPKTLGQLVIDSEAVKGWKSGDRKSIRVQIDKKDITSAASTVGAGVSTSTSLVPALRLPGILTPPEMELTVRDLIAPGETSQASVEYVVETGFTNAAKVVSEGAAKPKSNITFNLKTAPVRTIAHIFKASRNIMEDAPALRSYIDARARYGLRLAEEQELLLGDGTGQHIHGIIPQATEFAAEFHPTAEQAIDIVRLGILQAYLALFPPTGTVLHPIDWARIQLLKDTTGRYLIGNPVDSNVPRLWNLPLVQSMATDEGTFLTGNFRMATQIFDRMDIEILLSTENEDDFVKNMVTIRAEERLALAVYRPEAIIYGDFNTGT